jgi:hypothetical protein
LHASSAAISGSERSRSSCPINARGLSANGTRSVVITPAFEYAFNVLVDTPNGVAIDVEARPARFAAEVDAGRIMLARAGDRHGYRPKRVAADTAYGGAAFLAFVHERGTVPHIPVLERSEQTKGKSPREAFRYEREQDRYVCPAGKVLRFAGIDQKAGARR